MPDAGERRAVSRLEVDWLKQWVGILSDSDPDAFIDYFFAAGFFAAGFFAAGDLAAVTAFCLGASDTAGAWSW